MIDRNQLRFGIALFLFLAWVGALAAMALVTAKRPQARSKPANASAHQDGQAISAPISTDH